MQPNHRIYNRRAVREDEAGLTLIEVIVVAAVMSTMLLATVTFTTSAADATQISTQQLSDMRSRGENVRELRETFNQALVRQIAADGSSVRFSLPVPLGTQGSFVDDNGEIMFGTRGPDGAVLDDWYEITFVIERELDERALGRDLNFDGDQDDRFDEGRLEIHTQTGRHIATLQIPVVQPTGDLGGDINGDGLPDPLFRMDGLKIHLTFAWPNQAGYIAIWENRTSVAATNV